MSDTIAGEAKQDDTSGAKQDGAQDENGDSPETQSKQLRSVSFNNDVHVKRFGSSRESLGPPPEPPIRKEPFTHLSKEQILNEADKVREEADSLTCITDHPPERFYSLPHKKKIKSDRRDSTEVISTLGNYDFKSKPEVPKKPIGRSTSDVGNRRRGKERTSLSTIFRRNNRSTSPEVKVVIPKKKTIVKRSKSDASDLKSKSNLSNSSNSPIRKRAGSESEDNLKKFKNKKTQLSPIIEISPRSSYFQDTKKLKVGINVKKEVQPKVFKVNPVEKPPRFRSPENAKVISPPKPPVRTKKAKIVGETPKVAKNTTDKEHKTEFKKPVIVIDDVDSPRSSDVITNEVKNSIRESIDRLKNLTTYESNLHSSQQPPEKLPLTKGKTVEQIVSKFQGDSSNSRPNLLLNSSENNSYKRLSMSPERNSNFKSPSPVRAFTPLSKLEQDKEVVYAQVVCGKSEDGSTKQTIHKSYSPMRFSDIDEGLGVEDSKMSSSYVSETNYNYERSKNDSYNAYDTKKVLESPITPRLRDLKSPIYDEITPDYSNTYSSKFKEESVDGYTTKMQEKSVNESYFNSKNNFVGETKRFSAEPEPKKVFDDFNELSFRRELLESRTNRASLERRKPKAPLVSRYFDSDVEKRLKSTENYVNESSKYYQETKQKDGFAETVTEKEFHKYGNGDNQVEKTFERSKVASPSPYTTPSRTTTPIQRTIKPLYVEKTFENVKVSSPIPPIYDETFYERNKLASSEKIERNITPIYSNSKELIPPEPEYEPPSLEVRKQTLSPNEYVEKKYKVKNAYYASSYDVTDSKKVKSSHKKHENRYASNPNIEPKKETIYENSKPESKYSNYDSLRTDKDNKYIREEHYEVKKDVRDYAGRYDDKENRLVDSGIENDFRKEYSGDINRYKSRYSDDEIPSSKIIKNERRHTEMFKEEVYTNGGVKHRSYEHHKEDYEPKDRRIKDRSDEKFDSKDRRIKDRSDDKFDSKDRMMKERTDYHSHIDKFDEGVVDIEEKMNGKPPKSAKKLSGLEKVKQLFSRDSSKKSNKEKDSSPSPKTRVHDSPDRRSARHEEVSRRYTEYKGSSDEDPRRSDPEGEVRTASRYSHSKVIEHDANMAHHYSQRRRLATPSPTPSPSREAVEDTKGSWFKSLDRLSRKKNKSSKVTQDREAKTEDEASDHRSTLKAKSNKNVRYFGDTEIESEPNYTKKSTRHHDSDEYDPHYMGSKSYSLSNLNRDNRKDERSYYEQRSYRRNLQNISEVHSNSEAESHHQKRKHKDSSRSRGDHSSKPPMSPERRSRSHSNSKVTRKSTTPLKGSRSNLGDENGTRNSSNEVRTSRHELRGSRGDVRSRRRNGGTNSGESSTEGESSQHSQRSVVYLHATTVGDIPDPERTRARSRDDVSSTRSSPVQVKTVTRSFSLLAPWRPRHYGEEYDVNYAQTVKPSKRNKQAHTNGHLSEKRSYSQTALNKKSKPQSRLTNSSSNLYRKSRGSKENIDTNAKIRRERRGSYEIPILIENGSDRESSRSQNNGSKKVGWFGMNNKNKKAENTRVR